MKLLFLILMLGVDASAQDYGIHSLTNNFGDTGNPNNYKLYTQSDAINITEDAAFKREDVKLLTKNFEAWGWSCLATIGLNQQILSPVVIIAAPLAQQKLSTKGFGFHWEPYRGLTLRTDIEYYFNTGALNSLVSLNWRF